MSTEGLPGTTLRAWAEQIFDRVTLERVILPALADLQHECQAADGNRSAARWIRWRAYCSVWKTAALCLLRDTVRDRHGTSRTVAARMVIFLPVLVSLLLLPMVGWLVSFGAKHGIAPALWAGLMLAPQALIPALPTALLLSVSLHRTSREQPSALPGVVAWSVCCAAICLLLLMVVVPVANQAYRTVVFQAIQDTFPEGTAPITFRKGLSEMTWAELNQHVADPPSVREGERARAHRNERLAFVVVVPVLGLLGLSLAGRWRSRIATVGAALAVLILYWWCFSLGAGRYGQKPMYGPWTANVLFFLLAVGLLRARSARGLV